MQNLPGINTQEALGRLMNNEKLLYKLLSAFLRDYSTFIDQVMEHVEANDFDAARQKLHALKGVAANLSMTGLYESTKIAEDAALAKTLDLKILAEAKIKLQEVIEGLRIAEI